MAVLAFGLENVLGVYHFAFFSPPTLKVTVSSCAKVRKVLNKKK